MILEELDCPLRHGDYGQVQVGPNRIRHYRGIDDPETIQPVYPALLVYYGWRVT